MSMGAYYPAATRTNGAREPLDWRKRLKSAARNALPRRRGDRSLLDPLARHVTAVLVQDQPWRWAGALGGEGDLGIDHPEEKFGRAAGEDLEAWLASRLGEQVRALA